MIDRVTLYRRRCPHRPRAFCRKGAEGLTKHILSNK